MRKQSAQRNETETKQFKNRFETVLKLFGAFCATTYLYISYSSKKLQQTQNQHKKKQGMCKLQPFMVSGNIYIITLK